MDLKIISRLVRIMTHGDVTELEVEDSQSGLRVHLRRGAEEAPVPVVHVLPGAPAAAASMPAAGVAASVPPTTAPNGPPPGTTTFKSPMVGTFYRSPSPDSDSFVSPGSRVDAETVLCIIEAMKVMNEIKAECSGEIIQVLVENGEPVEYGQPLFLIKTA